MKLGKKAPAWDATVDNSSWFGSRPNQIDKHKRVGLVLDQIKLTKLVRPITINAEGKVIVRQTMMTMGGRQRLDDLQR